MAVPLAAFDLADWLSWTPLAYRGVSLNIAGLPGVFSLGELDDGTALLLDSFAERPLVAPRVLDFACGAGVIGAWLQASARAEGREVPVDGVDVQAQAVRCARETYARNGGQGTILASDGLSGVSGRWPGRGQQPPLPFWCENRYFHDRTFPGPGVRAPATGRRTEAGGQQFPAL